MATDVKKIKFVYFVYVHPKAFHLTVISKICFLTFASYIENLPEITLKNEWVQVNPPCAHTGVKSSLGT